MLVVFNTVLPMYEINDIYIVLTLEDELDTFSLTIYVMQMIFV